jgi:hypothetical protein
MRRFSRHLRSLAIALSVLALTAGTALAGRDMPAEATYGLDTAGEAAGKVVPVAKGLESPDPEIVPTVDEPVLDEPVLEEDDPEDLERPANHGALVSAAAQAATPDAFRNHGEYVSSVARGDESGPAAAKERKAKPAKAEKAGKTAAKARGGD